VIADFLTAFGLVFLAELPDKTMFATLLLATRFSQRLPVWLGVSTAYSAHVLVSASLGGFVARLPAEPVRNLISLIFVVAGAYLMWSAWRKGEGDSSQVDAESRSFRQIFGASLATVGVAEFADITQIATASLAATRSSPFAVGLGAITALVTVSGLAVMVGGALTRRLNVKLIQGVAGVLFVLIGVATFI
jgi:putative Ca2+/H+ antiporter (TMEM165/GDT1 family)